MESFEVRIDRTGRVLIPVAVRRELGLEKGARRSVAEAVLDSSAVLALLYGEPGSETVRKMLAGACMSAVNLAETAGLLQLAGMTSEESREALMHLGIEIVPFDDGASWAAAALHPLTQKLGLSLGDRTCLATAQVLNIEAVGNHRR